MDEKLITALVELTALDLAAASGYELAASVCADNDIRNRLLEFKGDHDRHVRDLSEHVTRAGQEPPSDIDPKGAFIVGFTRLSAQEDRSAVLAMRGNEELTSTAYASALRANPPQEIIELLARNFQDERRHMSWLRETILAQGWDTEQPEIKEIAAQFEQVKKAA